MLSSNQSINQHFVQLKDWEEDGYTNVYVCHLRVFAFVVLQAVLANVITNCVFTLLIDLLIVFFNCLL